MPLTTPPDRQQLDHLRPSSSKNPHRCTLLLLFGLWLAIYISSLFSPPLLDDADSTHASAARYITTSGDWVTLHVNGVRYLEKAPLPYWLVAISFRIFGFNTFAAHLPQAIGVLLLSLLGYLWANQVFGRRTALYTGLATLTSTGVFLFTRIFIPEILLSLFLCIALYCFFQTLDPFYLSLHATTEIPDELARRSDNSDTSASNLEFSRNLYPYATWTAIALAVLAKGLVALVFFFGTAAIYLILTGEWRGLRKLNPVAGFLLFLAIAAPWHILAGLRNTDGMDGHGFFWFYFINEHFLRFLGKRVPMDYNKLPNYLFWSLHLVWLFPWAIFIGTLFHQALAGFQRYFESNPLDSDQISYWQPFAVVVVGLALRDTAHIPYPFTVLIAITLFFFQCLRRRQINSPSGTPLLQIQTPAQRTTLLLTLFSALVLLFFSLSTNQEYYTFPAYLPLLMLIAAALAYAETTYLNDRSSRRWIIIGQTVLMIAGIVIAITLTYGLWSSRNLPFVSNIGSQLAHRGIGNYTLSMSHLFDLTKSSFAALRLPATLATLALTLGPSMSWILRHKRRHLAATVAIAFTSVLFLIAAHIAFTRFGPMLSSYDLAATIQKLQTNGHISSDRQIILYGDQAYGSSIPFYLGEQVMLVEGRSSSMLFGSTFPDAPRIFLSNEQFLSTWGIGKRKILFVPLEQRDTVDSLLGTHKILLAETAGKALYTDRPLDSPLSQTRPMRH